MIQRPRSSRQFWRRPPRRRILDASQLAEGENPGSNILWGSGGSLAFFNSAHIADLLAEALEERRLGWGQRKMAHERAHQGLKLANTLRDG